MLCLDLWYRPRLTKHGSSAWSTCVALAALLLAGGLRPLVAAAADAGAAYEKPPVLQASALVGDLPTSGPGYQIDAQVPTDGLMGHFTIRSGERTFEALGVATLAMRIAEIQAILELEKTSKTDVFVKAAAQAAERPVNAAVNMARHPVDTVSGLPAGVGRFFDRVQTGAKSFTEQKREGEPGLAKSVGQTSADALGYEQERRRLAKQLRVDPYTTNEILAKKLDDVAWVAFSGRVGVSVAVSVVVPGSMAISGTTMVNDLVWDTPPGDLVNRVNAKLDAMGVAEEKKRAFTGNRHIPLSLQATIVLALDRLSGVRGRPELIALAASVQSEDQARYVARGLEMLARHHETVPLASVSGRGTIVARERGGTIVVPAPVDYVSWTERVARFARRDDLKAPKREIWLSGHVSPATRRHLETMGWKITDEVS